MPKRKGWSLADVPDHLKEQNKHLFDRPVHAPGVGASKRPRKTTGAPRAARAPRVTEHDLQVSLINRCNAMSGQYPELRLLFAIPNGAKLPYTVDANGERYSKQGAYLRAEGLKAGVPDLFLSVARGRWHGLYIEMKRPGNKPSDVQNQWLHDLAAEGYACVVCYSDDEALSTILTYLKGKLR